MTNLEKFYDELIKHGDNAVHKTTGKLVRCIEISCDDCRFDGNCEVNLIKWLAQEYKEPKPTLTSKERAFCEVVGDGYVFRCDDILVVSFLRPEKSMLGGYRPDCDYKCLNNNFFKFIESNTYGWSIQDLLELEVCDEV